MTIGPKRPRVHEKHHNCTLFCSPQVVNFRSRGNWLHR